MSTDRTQANRAKTDASGTPQDAADPRPNSPPDRKPDAKPRRRRLDQLLVTRGLVESREQAKRLIMAGAVLVDEQVSDKPGKEIATDAAVRVRAQLPYVSRGGQKLAAALAAFDLSLDGRTAIDVGASTGGFTDCLLQHGIARVYAVDVGYGQLAWKLRNDARVVVLERTNIRHLAQLPAGEPADIAVIDASFISLALVLPPTLNLLQPAAHVIALIKPQFEAGQADVGKGGVVRDTRVHRRVIEETLALAHSLALVPVGLIVSPLVGPAGNVEFLVHLRREANTGATPLAPIGPDAVQAALDAAQRLRK